MSLELSLLETLFLASKSCFSQDHSLILFQNGCTFVFLSQEHVYVSVMEVECECVSVMEVECEWMVTMCVSPTDVSASIRNPRVR